MKLMSIPNGAEELGVTKQALYNQISDDDRKNKSTIKVVIKGQKYKVQMIDKKPFILIPDSSTPTNKRKK